MREELVESVFNIIKDLDSLAQIKRVFKGNDISIDSSLGKELVEKWKAAKSKEEASAPVYPAKSLNIESVGPMRNSSSKMSKRKHRSSSAQSSKKKLSILNENPLRRKKLVNIGNI